jgi:hypothetical protein
MTGTLLRLAAVLFLLVVGLVSVTTTSKNTSNNRASSTQSAPQIESPAKWEYRMVNGASPQLMLDQANQLGNESWKLVTVVQVVTDNRYHWLAVLKRPKR